MEVGRIYNSGLVQHGGGGGCGEAGGQGGPGEEPR